MSDVECIAEYIVNKVKNAGEKICAAPIELMSEACVELGLDQNNIESEDFMGWEWEVYDKLLELSKKKVNGFNMRAVPAHRGKEIEPTGMPYCSEYYFSIKIMDK